MAIFQYKGTTIRNKIQKELEVKYSPQDLEVYKVNDDGTITLDKEQTKEKQEEYFKKLVHHLAQKAPKG